MHTQVGVAEPRPIGLLNACVMGTHVSWECMSLHTWVMLGVQLQNAGCDWHVAWPCGIAGLSVLRLLLLAQL